MTVSLYAGTIYDKVKGILHVYNLIWWIKFYHIEVLSYGNQVASLGTHNRPALVYIIQIAKKIKSANSTGGKVGLGRKVIGKNTCRSILLISCGLMGLTGRVTFNLYQTPIA